MGSRLGSHKFSVEDDSKSDDSTTHKDRDNSYEEFCKDLIFIEGKEITVKKKQRFAMESTSNYSIPTEFQDNGPFLKSTDKEIKFIESKDFNLYPDDICGGDTKTIYVFQGIKEGQYKINFSSFEINVTII